MSTNPKPPVADEIVLLYRQDLKSFNRTAATFLAMHHRNTYSRSLADPAAEVRELWHHLRDKVEPGQLKVESSHLVHVPNGRFVVAESLSCEDFELRMCPTDRDLRQYFKGFVKDNPEPTGVDAITSYIDDLRRNDTDYYHSLRLKSGVAFHVVMDELQRLLRHWRSRAVWIHHFSFDRQAIGSKMKIELLFKEPYSHYLSIEAQFA